MGGRPARRVVRRSAWWRTTGAGSAWRWERRIATTRVRPGCSRCGSRPTRAAPAIGRALVEHVVVWARSRGLPGAPAPGHADERRGDTSVRTLRIHRRGCAAPTPRGIRRDDDVHDDGSVGVSDESDRLVAEQIRYYDDRASEYEDLWFRRGRYDMGQDFNEGWFRETALVEAAVDAFDAERQRAGAGVRLGHLDAAARATRASTGGGGLVGEHDRAQPRSLRRGQRGVRARGRVRVGAGRAVRRGVDGVLHLPHPAGSVRAVLGATRDVAAAGWPALPDRGRRRSRPPLLGRCRGGRAGVRASSSAGRRSRVHDREAVLRRRRS